MGQPASIHEMICDISAIVQRFGQHDFSVYDAGDAVKTISLCGLVLYSADGILRRLQAHDMDLMLDHHFQKPANDKPVLHMSDYSHCHFTYGNSDILALWYSRLKRFEAVFNMTDAVSA